MRVRLLIPLLGILVILLLVSACSTDDEDAPAETGAQATSTPVDDRAGEQATAIQPTRTPAPVQPSPTTSPSDGNDEESQPAREPTNAPSHTPSTDGDAGDTDIDAEIPDEPTATGESANDLAPAEPENPAPELGSIDEWHNGDPVGLSDLRGSTVLLVFWADY